MRTASCCAVLLQNADTATWLQSYDQGRCGTSPASVAGDVRDPHRGAYVRLVRQLDGLGKRSSCRWCQNALRATQLRVAIFISGPLRAAADIYRGAPRFPRLAEL